MAIAPERFGDDSEKQKRPSWGSDIALGPLRSAAVSAGLVPPAIVLLLIAGALWGSGVRLSGVSKHLAEEGGTGAGRQGAAWLAVVLFLLLVAAGALTPLVRLLRTVPMFDEYDVSKRTRGRYGVDLISVWPHLADVLPENAALSLRRKAARVDALAGVCVGWYLALVLGMALLLIAGWSWLLGLLVLIVCALFAGATFVEMAAAARELWAARENALDLYRFNLFEAMHLKLPSSSSEERDRFLELDRLLQRGPAATTVDYEHRALETSLPDELAGRLRTTITQAFEDAVAEPILANYAGVVSVVVEDSGGRALHPNDSGVVPVHPRAPHHLAITFAKRSRHGPNEAPIEVTDGRDASEVVFNIMLDSNAVYFPFLARDVVVPVEREETKLTVSFEAPEPAGEHGVWVHVLQSRRLLQRVLIKLSVEESEAEQASAETVTW